jgi:transposase-like protein
MKSLKPNQTESRRKYDPTFKLEAVQNWISSGKTAEVVAEELGLTSKRLYAWRKLLPPAPAGGGAGAGGRRSSSSELQAQLDVALRENRHLREQRDILKKTLGILSEPSPSASSGCTR